MKIIPCTIILGFAFLSLCSCSNQEQNLPVREAERVYKQETFNSYWYAGKAEIASYNLKQSRYGELHEGKAVLIFVTEPFSAAKHVKLDRPEANNKDKVTVMKLNLMKKFNTGIYPYSMMLSVFTPIDDHQNSHTLKATMSAQEWCGQVYSQMNLTGNKYAVNSFSYFEQEGDQEFKIEATLLEDELWNRIRLNYKTLPTGNIKVIPGLFYTRLMHEPLEPVEASASLKIEKDEARYSLNYPERTLTIVFKTKFPYKITSWEESYKGPMDKVLTTSASLDKELFIDYWTKNRSVDSYLRDSLNLD